MCNFQKKIKMQPQIPQLSRNFCFFNLVFEFEDVKIGSLGFYLFIYFFELLE